MSYRLNRAAAYAFAGISLAAMSGTAMADVLVASSSGAAAREYPRGTRLGDTQQITLGRGDSITLITSSGTRRFRGPGRYSAASGRRIASSPAGTTRGSRGRARTGVSRGPGGESAALHPERQVWQVDVQESGTFCYLPTQNVSLWRSSAEAPSEITITNVADNSSETLTFDDGQSSKAWPASLPASPGAEYRISYAGMMVATRITFAQLSADPSDQVAVGSALLENSCDAQLDALVEQSLAEAAQAANAS